MRSSRSALLVLSLLCGSQNPLASGQEAAEKDAAITPAVQAALDALRQEQQAQLDALRQRYEEELSGLRSQLQELTAALGGGSPAERRSGFEVQRYSWQQGQGPVKMIHKDEGICFLTRVGGGFEGGGEVVLIQLGDDGYYYLSGTSGQAGIHAEATSVRFASLPSAEPAAPDDPDLATDAAPASDNVVEAGSASESAVDPEAASGETATDAAGDAQMERRKLPAAYDDLAAGGGGRYLIFRLKGLRKLAIFDTHEAKIVKYISLASDDALFAAGREKLLIVLPAKRIVQRYNLTDFKRETSRALPVDGTVMAVAMGAASDGPLLIQTGGEFGSGGVSLLDVESLQKLDVQFEGGGHSLGDPGFLWASADGGVFGLERAGISPSGLTTVVVRGNKATIHYQHDSVGHVIPSPDGTLIFTASGLFTPEGLPLSRQDAATPFAFPCVHPAYYLSVGLAEYGFGRGFDEGRRAPQLSIHTTMDQRLLLTLPAMDELLPSEDSYGPYDLPSRVFFIPEAKRLITIPATRDALVIRNLDIVEALEKADIDYLFVESLPIRTALRGEAYRYPIEVQSRLGDVRYVLDSGPEGMELSPGGELTWQPPEDFDEDSVGVIVTVVDASEQEVLHAFELRVK